jgi:hypothetical protein
MIAKISKIKLIELVERFFQQPCDTIVITELGEKFPDGFEISRKKVMPGDVLLVRPKPVKELREEDKDSKDVGSFVVCK